MKNCKAPGKGVFIKSYNQYLPQPGATLFPLEDSIDDVPKIVIEHEDRQRYLRDLERRVEASLPDRFSIVGASDLGTAVRGVKASRIVNEALQPESSLPCDLFDLCLLHGLNVDIDREFLAAVSFYVFGEYRYTKAIPYLVAYVVKGHGNPNNWILSIACEALDKIVESDPDLYRKGLRHDDTLRIADTALRYWYRQ